MNAQTRLSLTSFAVDVGMFLALALCIWFSVYSPPAPAADWVDDWFDQSASTPAGSLQTQKRGYYTGGSFQGRWRMNNDYLLTVTPPRLKAGCGGLDMFLGGFSYLDAEYLVEKMEAIIQAAPAFAFDLAMQEYCKPCSATMQTMTEITDYLNSIQVNDCRIAQQVGAYATNNVMSALNIERVGSVQSLAISTGQSKNSADVAEDIAASGGKPPVGMNQAFSQCPTLFKNVFLSGSVVGNVAGLVGLSGYADVMRGLIGDVNVTYSNSEKQYLVRPLEPCPGNDPADGFDLVNGKMDKRANTGACSPAGMEKVGDIIEDKLSAIAGKLDAGGAGALGGAEEDFIAGAPLPLLNALRDSVAIGVENDMIVALRDPLASAYAFRILDDLHRATRIVLSKATEVNALNSQATTDPVHCDTSYLEGAFVHLKQMDERALLYREMAKASYHKQQAELLTNIQVARQMLEQRRQMLNSQQSFSE